MLPNKVIDDMSLALLGLVGLLPIRFSDLSEDILDESYMVLSLVGLIFRACFIPSTTLNVSALLSVTSDLISSVL